MSIPSGRDPADLFAEALELPPEDRAAYLDRACGLDGALRAEVESLLASHARSGSFFDQPLVAAPPPSMEPPSRPVTAQTVGPWRLGERIAVGGMGEVYRGERIDQEFHKQVAIKVIRTGLDSEEVLARFRRERQVLASLEHPNIGRLLDGGSTAEGLPCLVMEYVDGLPIDRWCDERRLAVPERLRLFLTVCEAVHYAHCNLVIHRDVKPGNIMVDHAGVVKLLDFGIARVAGTEGQDAALTLTGPRMLTPRYASPEQVSGGRVSTATDIYSLGVVLYELLTGRSPYGDARTPFELEQAVLQGTTPRPSQVVRETFPDAQARSLRRGVVPRRLAQLLAGDLDTIVLRALSRDPGRRYSSVQGFADDIRRHLDGRPVHARPDTAIYRISRFARRNRGLAAGVAAALVTLAVALVLTTAAYRKADRSRREAEWLAYVNSLAAAEGSIRSNQLSEAARQLASAPERLRGWEWNHLQGRLDRSRLRWQAHAQGLTVVHFVDEGRQVLTASIDGTVRLWSSAGESLAAWGPFDSPVESAVAIPGGASVIAGLEDGRVMRLPLSGGGAPAALGRGHALAMVDASPDGRRIAAGFLDGSVRVWDAADGLEEAVWQAHPGLVVAGFDPSGAMLATGGAEGGLRFWTPDGRPARPDIQAHRKRIYSLAWNPGGDRIAVGSMDHAASVWSVGDGAPLGGFREHRGTVAGLAFLDHGASVLSAGADGRLLIWSVETGVVESELHGHLADVSALAVSPDGRTLATGDWSGSCRLWDRFAEDVRTLTVPDQDFMVARVLDARFDPAGRRLIGVTNTNTAVAWWLADRRVRTWELPGGVEIGFAADPASVIAITAGGALLTMDAETGAVLQETVAHHGAATALAVHAASGRVATAGSDSLVRIWALPELTPVAEMDGLHAGIHGLVFSPDGDRLVAAGEGGRLRIWDAATGAGADPVPSDAGSLLAVAAHPDGVRLATGSYRGEVRFWDLSTGAPGPPLLERPTSVFAAAFSPDGKRLAVGTGDQLVRILDAETGRELLALHGHTARLASLEWSPDGSLLASAALDGTVRIWDSVTGREGGP